MTIFILVSILLVAALAIALLMGVSPASPKVKVRTMYVGAALMLVVALVVCDYIDIQVPISCSIGAYRNRRLSLHCHCLYGKVQCPKA